MIIQTISFLLLSNQPKNYYLPEKQIWKSAGFFTLIYILSDTVRSNTVANHHQQQQKGKTRMRKYK